MTTEQPPTFAAATAPPPPPPPPAPPLGPAFESSGPPPRYAAVVKKVYPYSLRPIVIFVSILGAIWGIAMGVECIRDRADSNSSDRQKMMALAQGILYFVIALIEVAFIVIAFMHNLSVGRLIIVLAPLGVILTLGAQILNVVRHFILKSDLIAQCAANTFGATYQNSSGVEQKITGDQARNICTTAWDRGTWTVIAWLIVSVILAAIFASLTLAFYRQLLDPSSVRTRQRGNAVETYALQPNDPYAHNPPPPLHNQGQQAWMVPPYPGPPGPQMQPGYEKGDYQPSAEWASYGVDGSPQRPSSRTGGAGYQRPLSASGFGGAGSRAQDEAWERAEASGPTAHLTGGRRSPRLDVESGYVVKNTEEDEAWERARTEGVTAHLTGGGSRPNGGRLV